ncbi:hypothetical protein ABIB35_003438 [Arthrobacter sp. UYP6]
MEQPDECLRRQRTDAAQLLNYLVNNEEAAKVIKLDRGMQANLDIRGKVLPLLDATKQQEAVYLDRQLFEVLFGRLSVEEAAKAFTAEVNANLAGN